MVIMSEWVYGNGKRQRRGRGTLQCVFCQIQLQPGYCCQQLEHVPLQVDNLCNTDSLLCLHIANIEKISFFFFLLYYEQVEW